MGSRAQTRLASQARSQIYVRVSWHSFLVIGSYLLRFRYAFPIQSGSYARNYDFDYAISRFLFVVVPTASRFL